MKTGGPLVLPADCETAIEALDRAYKVHMANYRTKWLDQVTRHDALLKAARCERGIELVIAHMRELKHLIP